MLQSVAVPPSDDSAAAGGSRRSVLLLPPVPAGRRRWMSQSAPAGPRALWLHAALQPLGVLRTDEIGSLAGMTA